MAARLLNNLVISIENESENNGPFVNAGNNKIYIKSFQGSVKNTIFLEDNAVNLDVAVAVGNAGIGMRMSNQLTSSLAVNQSISLSGMGGSSNLHLNQSSYVAIVSDTNKIYTYLANKSSNGNLKQINLKGIDLNLIKNCLVSSSVDHEKIKNNFLSQSSRIELVKMSPKGNSCLVQLNDKSLVCFIGGVIHKFDGRPLKKGAIFVNAILVRSANDH